MEHPIAYCGLACCVCSENTACPGCKNDGCTGKDWCGPYRCCREKGLSGCWECASFPCGDAILNKPRVRAFVRFAKQYGEDWLADRLLKNQSKGIRYHYQGQLIGDYDQKTEEEIFRMLLENTTHQQIILQQADQNDVSSVNTLFQRVIKAMLQSGIDQWDEKYPNRNDIQTDITHHQIYLLFLDKKVAAAVTVNEQQEPEYQNGNWQYAFAKTAVIHRFCVDPEYQHQGLGKRIITCLEMLLANKGYQAIRLDAFSKNPQALALYESLGYKKAGSVNFRKGLFYLYEKQL